MDASKFGQYTSEDVASAMKMTLTESIGFAHAFESNFRSTRIQTRNGKKRPIDAPYKSTKKKLKKLHRWFQKNRLFHPTAHGGVKGRSCFTSATLHCGANRIVWTRDASDCFPSVSPESFEAELLSLGFRQETAKLLTMLCTVRSRIPQGSPVSNDALNLYFYRVDGLLHSFCGSMHLAYSRVADDFVVSGKSLEPGEKAIGLVERELKKRGISINHNKKRKNGRQVKHQSRLVHNICVNSGRGTKLNPEHRTAITHTAESYVAACKSAHSSSLEP